MLGFRTAWPAFVGVVLYACTPAPVSAPPPSSNVNYNGETYPDAASALDAMRTNLDSYVARVRRISDPVRGTALIVVPDVDRLRPLAGQRLFNQRKVAPPPTAVDNAAQALSITIHSEAEGLLASGAFETASIREQNQTFNPDMGDADYLVWFQVRTAKPDGTGGWVGNWLLRRGHEPKIAILRFDPGVAEGTPRLEDWSRRLRVSALQLGGVSVAGQTEAGTVAGGASTEAGGGPKSGTGVILDRNGVVLTNAHVVAGCTAPRVIDADKDNYAATVLARDTVNDLALIKAPSARWRNVATLGDDREPDPGESVPRGRLSLWKRARFRDVGDDGNAGGTDRAER